MNGSVWEIEELPSSTVSEPRQARTAEESDIYVAVGKTSSSIDALSWALTHLATPSSIVYLIHIFPEVHSIPTPLGVVPKNRVSSQQVERHMNQERVKRSQMLQKFMNLCQASKVQVDTLLVESDQVANAVVELISVLGIKRLIVGTAKSNIRKLKGSSKAEKIHKTAPHYCEVKIICGREAIAYPDISSPPPITEVGRDNGNTKSQLNKVTVSCHCFSRNFK